MRTRVAALACTLVAAAAAAFAAAPASAADEPAGFVVQFAHYKKANRHAASIVRRSGAMQAVADEVNARWTLPFTMPVLFSDQIADGPVFLTGLDITGDDGARITSLINFPGPFLNIQLENVRKQLEGVKGVTVRRGVVSAVQFVLAHEIGHAIIHEFRLPVLGKEEDAADSFAAYLLTANPKFGPLTAISAAAVWDSLAPMSRQLDESDFSDEHSFPRQRMYQFLCWVYGSDTKRFRPIVGRDALPKERAARCGREWREINAAWDTVLAPHLRTPAPTG
jgi:hypothetical protein